MRRTQRGGALRLLLAVAGGAAATWLLSPTEGARRRALLRDGLRSRARRARTLAGKLGRDVRNRAIGAAHRARTALAEEGVSDETLVQRVRARLGRELAHARAVAVEAQGGNVVLRGAIPPDQAERVLRAARSVRGVASVEDHLERHAACESAPGEGGGERSAP
jgi:osmotically-inducible protein OsmY